MTFMQKTEAYMEEYQSTIKNREASIRDLETQLSEMSKQLSERPQVMFPSDTMVNLREQCNEESPLGYATYEVPSCKSISIQIRNFDKEEFPKKKQRSKS
jgi:hypothetical protein